MWPWDEINYQRRRLVALFCACVIMLAFCYLVTTGPSVTDNDRVTDPETEPMEG